MLKDTTVVRFRQPEAIDDPLSELAREGARRMLAQALVAEADAFVALWKGSKLPDGRDRVVRHGHGPHRAVSAIYTSDFGPFIPLRSSLPTTVASSPLTVAVLTIYMVKTSSLSLPIQTPKV